MGFGGSMQQPGATVGSEDQVGHSFNRDPNYIEDPRDKERQEREEAERQMAQQVEEAKGRPIKFGKGEDPTKLATSFAAETPGYTVEGGDPQEISLAQILEERARQRSEGALGQYAQVGREARQRQMEIANRRGPQIDTRKQEQFRGRQQELADILGARVRGETTSAAEQQFAQSQEALLRGAASQAASARGVGNAALQSRQLGEATTQIGLQGAQQGAILRSQEQQAAETALGALAAEARQQDIGLAAQQTQFEMQSEQLREGLIQNLMAQRMDAAEAERLAGEFISALTANFLTGNASAAAQRAQAGATREAGWLNAGATVLGAIAGRGG